MTTKLQQLFRYLFNRPEYGDLNGFNGIYRRFARSGVIEFKSEIGWEKCEHAHRFKFMPTDGREREMTLPDGSIFTWTDKRRDEIGELKFSELVAKARKQALDNLKRRKVRV